MKISTIIPVYNTEKYLEKCIDSIINQTIGFKNIELIIVDDGSPDNSKDIIEKYTNKFDNIKYIYKENGGQASARNLGLKKATGEYISFVDSDDWIDKDMYLELYNKAISKDYDIVTCDYTFIKQDGNEYVSFKFTDDSNNNFIIMNTGPCNMIINRKFLISRNFSFPEGIVYEDLAVIPSLGMNSKIYHINKSFYNYLIRANSTMNNKEYSDKLEDIFKAFDNLYNIFDLNNGLEKYYDEVEFLYIRRLMMSASLRFIQFGDPNKCIIKISDIIKNNYSNWKNNKYYKKLPFKQKIVAILTYYRLSKLLSLLYKINARRQS